MTLTEATASRLARRRRMFKILLLAYVSYLVIAGVCLGILQLDEVDTTDQGMALFIVFLLLAELGAFCIPLLGLLVWGLTLYHDLRKRFIVLITAVSVWVAFAAYSWIWLLKAPI